MRKNFGDSVQPVYSYDGKTVKYKNRELAKIIDSVLGNDADPTNSALYSRNLFDEFISLKKSLSNGVCVQFNVIGDVANIFILPRILITFVENAFKHGDAYLDNNPISIKLIIENKRLHFEVSNQKNTHRHKPTSTGIGQNNLKEQLELFYKNSYELIINDGLENYSTILIFDK